MKRIAGYLFAILLLAAFAVSCETPDVEEGTEEPGTEPVDPPVPPVPPVPDETYALFGIPEYEDELGALAFPGAEGGGMYVTGGRGGKIIHVTSLEDSGTGTLRAALNESGPRIIVFDVAGHIRLKSPLKITKGDVTIAGQTAPGDGICISDNSVEIQADNVIVRFVRFRLGDEGAGLGDSSDAFWGRYHENIIIDHCSMSWSIDECASFYANRNFTMQWCIIAEALNESKHSKGGHGYGGLWGGKNASFHHNMLADNNSRNARIDHPQIYGEYVSTHRGNVDYRNNVIYNWGNESTYGGEDGSFNIVGNYYKPGPASVTRNYFVNAYWYYEKGGTVYSDSYPNLYMTGNFHAGKSGVSSINADNYAGISYKDQSKDAGRDNPEPGDNELSAPLPIKADDTKLCHVTTHSAQNAYEAVLDYAGASLSRDDVDERIVSHAEAGTAAAGNGIIDSQEEVGGWPAYEGEPLIDNDGDGMPDGFEIEFGLDPDDASDASAMTLDPYGRYTNIEMYLHYLVKDIVSGQNSTGYYGALD